MNNTFPLELISKTGSLDSNLILRQYKLDSMVKFMAVKFVNEKVGFDLIKKIRMLKLHFTTL